MQTGRKLAFSDIWMHLETESVIYNVRVCVMFSDKAPDWPAALTQIWNSNFILNIPSVFQLERVTI